MNMNVEYLCITNPSVHLLLGRTNRKYHSNHCTPETALGSKRSPGCAREPAVVEWQYPWTSPRKRRLVIGALDPQNFGVQLELCIRS